MNTSQASNFIGNSNIPEYAKNDLNGLLESQQKTIESMKCCGNCGVSSRYSSCVTCTRYDGFTKPNATDNWKPIN